MFPHMYNVRPTKVQQVKTQFEQNTPRKTSAPAKLLEQDHTSEQKQESQETPRRHSQPRFSESIKSRQSPFDHQSQKSSQTEPTEPSEKKQQLSSGQDKLSPKGQKSKGQESPGQTQRSRQPSELPRPNKSSKNKSSENTLKAQEEVEPALKSSKPFDSGSETRRLKSQFEQNQKEKKPQLIKQESTDLRQRKKAQANSTDKETSSPKPPLRPQTPSPTQKKHPFFKKEISIDKPNFQRQISQESDSNPSSASSASASSSLKRKTSLPSPTSSISKEKKSSLPAMSTDYEMQGDGWGSSNNNWDDPSEKPKKSSIRLRNPAKKDGIGSNWRTRPYSVPNEQSLAEEIDDWDDDIDLESNLTQNAKEFFGVPLKKVPLKDKWEKQPTSPKTPPAKDLFKVNLKKVPESAKPDGQRKRPASWTEEVQLKPVPEETKKKTVRIADEFDEDDEESMLSTNQVDEAGVPPPPPPPPGAPGAPPPPPPPGKNFMNNPKTHAARQKLVEQIKKASRTRPDWIKVMKDVEGGVKLKRVKTEERLDRSSPILPQLKNKEGAYIYDSEKPKAQFNKMLREIQTGIRLRHVKTNDRSRPDFNKLGLRRLRRQRTNDEIKTIDPDAPEALPSSSDEESEDIDNMRDDLRSTKVQLADEIKKNKMVERENKILKIDIDSLRADVKKLKRQMREAGIQEVKPIKDRPAGEMAPQLSKSMSKLRMKEEDLDFSELDIIDEEIGGLKSQIDAQQKRAEKAEQKVEELAQKLRLSTCCSDEWEMRSVYFEKKFKGLQKEAGIELPEISCVGIQTEPIDVVPITPSKSGPCLSAKKSVSRKSFGSIYNRMESFQEEDEESISSLSEEDEEETDEETEEELEIPETEVDETMKPEAENKKKEKEAKMMNIKLKQTKEKERNLKHDRRLLRDRIRKLYSEIKEEKDAYIQVKKDLDELAETLKEANESEDDEEREERLKNKKEPTKYKPRSARPTKRINLNEDEDEAEEEEDEFEGEETEEEEEETEEEETDEEATDDEEDEDEVEEEEGITTPDFNMTSESEEDSEIEEDIDEALATLHKLTKKHEENLTALKTENSDLKKQADRYIEMLQQEKRRHARLDHEMQMLVASIE